VQPTGNEIKRENPERVQWQIQIYLTLSGFWSLTDFSVGFTYGYSNSSLSGLSQRNISY
jgi:hypothetical protein